MRQKHEPGHTPAELDAIQRCREALRVAYEAAAELSRSLNARNAYSFEMSAAANSIDHARRMADDLLTLDEFVSAVKVSASSRKTRQNTKRTASKAT